MKKQRGEEKTKALIEYFRWVGEQDDPQEASKTLKNPNLGKRCEFPDSPVLKYMLTGEIA